MKIFLFFSLWYKYIFIHLQAKTDNKQINIYQHEVL